MKPYQVDNYQRASHSLNQIPSGHFYYLFFRYSIEFYKTEIKTQCWMCTIVLEKADRLANRNIWAMPKALGKKGGLLWL
jgi:hypothetical protein